MGLKKHNSQVEPESSATESNFNYEDQHKEIVDSLGVSANAIDSNEPDVPEKTQVDIEQLIKDVTARETAKVKAAEADNTMTSVPGEAYKTGGVSVEPSTDKKAYQGPLLIRQREDLIKRLQTHTATEEDMALIDESMVMDLPFIKAADFTIPGQYNPKPKDPSIRFRWVNCINALQSNMQRFLALGFTLARRDDVDEVKTPLAESMIDGTQIRQYDVVLMKIPVLQLMALYKRNVQDSLFKLDGVTSGNMSKAAAEQTFSDDISHDLMARSGYNKVRSGSGKEPVTFNRT